MAQVRRLLARQLLEPVLWEDTLGALLENEAAQRAPGEPRLFELGPGQQIRSMVKRISSAAWRTVVNVQP